MASGEFVVEASICTWENNALSQPLIKFKTAEALLTMILTPDEQTLILSGVKQQLDPKKGNIDALYAACDLKSRKILWRTQLAGSGFSESLSVSPDGKQFWTQGVVKQQRFETRTGRATTDLTNIPYFSLDGKHAVQRVTGNRGQRPYLAAFHLFEKR